MPRTKTDQTKKSDIDFTDTDMDAFLGISDMDGVDFTDTIAQPAKVKKRKLKPNLRPRDMLKRSSTGLFPLFVHNNIIYNKSSNHNIHLELLGQALRRTLLQRDYQRAYRLYSKMICIKGVNEEAWWKIGAELLRQKSEYEPNCIQFLKTMFAKAITCRIPIMIETGLYLMRCGRFDEAHETMEPHADSTPYSADSKYQGILGLVEFALWQKGVDTVRSAIQDRRGGGWDGRSVRGESMDIDDDSSQTTLVQQDGDHDDEHDHDQEIAGLKSKAQRFKLAAILHLEKALKLDAKNDLFLAHLIMLRCGTVDIKGVHGKISTARMEDLREMRGYLKEFLGLNQNNLLALQLLASVETAVVEAPSRENTLTQILGLDPAADSDRYVVPWIRILTSKMTPNQAQIIEDIESTRLPHSLPSTVSDQDFLASFQCRDTDPAALPLELSALTGKRRERRLVPWKESTPREESNKNVNIPRRKSQTDLDLDVTLLSKDHSAIVKQLDRHQPNVAYYRPVLELLLARAEYGVLTAWEEAEITRITNLFCFCSLYCRRLTSVMDLTAATGACDGSLKSYFEQLPEEMRPPWYTKVVEILSRPDDFEVPAQPSDE